MSEKSFSFQEFMQDIPDPRQQAKVVYPLDEILLLCLCGVVAGCDSFVEIAAYGVEKLDFLGELSGFAAGIPSHDTLSAVFRQLDPVAFSDAFAGWALSFRARLDGTIVAVDGKTSRGSKAGGCAPLHMITALCDDMRLVLGQRPSGHKKNEIRDIFEASGCSVSQGRDCDHRCHGVSEEDSKSHY